MISVTDFRYDTFRRLTANPTVTTRIISGHTYDFVGRYSLPKTIGSGAFAHLISAWDSKVAIKKIRLPSINNKETTLFYARSLRFTIT